MTMRTNRILLTFFFLPWISPAFSPAQTVDTTAVENITPQRVKAKLDSSESIALIDVRTPEEFVGPLGHIAGSVLIPLQELGQRIQEIEPIQERPIIVYCRSGNRSRDAVEFLAKRGIRAFNMTGGMREWNRLGYPVSRKKPREEDIITSKPSAREQH
jgi:phage shock protein E